MSTIRFQFKHGHVLPHHGTAIFRGDDALALPSAPVLVVAGRQLLFVFLSFRDREINQQATYLPSRAEQASVRHHLLYNESLELTAPQHTAVKI
jgi:hypothetical protein